MSDRVSQSNWRVAGLCLLTAVVTAVLVTWYQQRGREEAAAPVAPPPSPPAMASVVANNEPPTNIKIMDRKSGEVHPDRGGSIQINDGFSVTIPPGAVDRPVTLQVERVFAEKGSHYLIEDCEFYRITGAELAGKLTKPAVLRFPYDPTAVPESVKPEEILIMHRLESGQLEPLQGRPVPEAGYVEVEATSFSEYFRFWPWGEYARLADEATRAERPYLVRASYYSQQPYDWCWAASAAMMIATHNQGKGPTQPQQIAEVFGKTKRQSGSLWPVIGVNLGDLHAKLNLPPDLPIRQYALGTLTETNLRGFLVHCLKRGRPVWVGLKHYEGFLQGDHAVLIVGYDADGFFIHDSSGALVGHIVDLRGGGQVNQAKLAAFHVTYKEWSQVFAPQVMPEHLLTDILRGIPGFRGVEGLGQVVVSDRMRSMFANLAYVDIDPPAQPKSVTMQVLSELNGIQFYRDDVGRDPKERRSLYQWNGKVTGGGGFSTEGIKDETLLGTEGLCNSDWVGGLNIHLHNTSDQDFSGFVVVQLDDQVVGEPVPVRVGMERTNETDNVATLETPARKALKDGLDFRKRPLAMGPHVLHVILQDPNGGKQDSVVIPFVMRPAVVPNVACTRKIFGSSSGDHRYAEDRVTWDASPEEARLGAGRFAYQVYRTGKHNPVPFLIATIPSGRREEVRPVGNAIGSLSPLAEEVKYQVSLVDTATGLESPLSKPAEVRVEQTPPAGEPVADADLTGAKGDVTKVIPDADLSGGKVVTRVTPNSPQADPQPQNEPFYAVFDLYLPYPPQNNQGELDEKAPDERWTETKKLTRVAYHIKGDALIYYANETRNRLGGGQRRDLIFDRDAYYYQHMSMTQKNQQTIGGPFLLRFVGSTKEGLATFGRLSRWPIEKEHEGVIADMSEGNGSVGRTRNGDAEFLVGPIVKAQANWANIRPQAIPVARTIFQFFGDLGGAIGEKLAPFGTR